MMDYIMNEKEAIMKIKLHAKELGYDLSKISDEKIKKSIIKFSFKVKDIGVSTKEAGKAFTKLAKAINETMSYNKTLNLLHSLSSEVG